jgi:AcrR family transcriptional regulator
MNQVMKKQLNRDDWLAAALETLDEKGIDAVKVLPLSKRLGVTRGSFYWHFADREDLVNNMLDYWETELTDRVVAMSRATEGSARDKLLAVARNVLTLRQDRYDQAIDAWALFDDRAEKALKRVSRKRVRYLTDMLELAGFEKKEAGLRARFLYGFLLVDRRALTALSKARLEILAEEAVDFILR